MAADTDAAAMLVAERAWAEKNGLQPMAKLVSYGIVTLCIGGGQGIALALEML